MILKYKTRKLTYNDLEVLDSLELMFKPSNYNQDYFTNGYKYEANKHGKDEDWPWVIETNNSGKLRFTNRFLKEVFELIIE